MMHAERVSIARPSALRELHTRARGDVRRASAFFSAAQAPAAGAGTGYFTASGGGGPTTTPSFVGAGAGSMIASGGGNLLPTYPANVSGDLFLALSVAYLSATSTPAGWTQVAGPNTTASANLYMFTRDARATGSDSGTVAFPLGDRGNARIYGFRNCALASPVEAIATTSGAGTVTNPTVAPGGPKRLGVLGWLGYSTVGTIVPGGTPSGGTWAEVSEFVDIPTDIFFQELQTADLSGGGAISGGTTTFGGTSMAFCYGFALVGV